MNPLRIKPVQSCKYDLVSLGEVMLRLDPGENRIHNANSFQTWEGGGEYNVAKGLSSCFKLRTGIVTALVDNEIGQLIEGKIRQGRVDTSLIQWVPFDGVGRTARNGLYFMERGFGVRGAKGVSDRGSTAVSQLKPGDIDWDDLFGKQGVRWFHTGGIFAGLSPSAPQVIEEAMISAKKHGTVISYDLNYRPSLWDSVGGKEVCDQINNRIKPYLDILIGVDNLKPSAEPDWELALKNVILSHPNLKMVASTVRTIFSASKHDWGAVCLSDGQYTDIPKLEDLDIFDRVGGGDAFAAGLIYGLLASKEAAQSLLYGQAHGALTMTTPGDTSLVSLEEVESFIAGNSGNILR